MSQHAKSKHICIITETYLPEVNGVAMTLSRLSEGLQQLGYHISIVRPRQNRQDREGCEAQPQFVLVKGFPIPGYQGMQLGLPNRGRLRRFLLQQRPELIYIATEGPLGKSALKFAEQLNIPTLSGFHTNFHNYTKHYKLGLLYNMVIKYLRRFHNRTAGTLVPNMSLLNELDSLGFNNVSLMERGVDCELYGPHRRSETLRQQWGVTATDKVALYVGRVAPEKNIPLAMQSYYAMRRHAPALKLVVVGDGPLYEQLAKAHPEVSFCGIHRGKVLAEHYASADIFLFPSESETFGNVVLEAMASGLAVLAYNYAAAERHIRQMENGMLVPFGDADSYVKTAVSWIQNHQQYQHLGKNARTHAESISWTSVVAQFENLITDAIAKNNAISQQVA